MRTSGISQLSLWWDSWTIVVQDVYGISCFLWSSARKVFFFNHIFNLAEIKKKTALLKLPQIRFFQERGISAFSFLLALKQIYHIILKNVLFHVRCNVCLDLVLLSQIRFVFWAERCLVQNTPFAMIMCYYGTWLNISYVINPPGNSHGSFYIFYNSLDGAVMQRVGRDITSGWAVNNNSFQSESVHRYSTCQCIWSTW